MKRISILFITLIIAQLSIAQNIKLDTIYYSGPPSNRLNMVFIGDGYDSSQQSKQVKDIKAAYDDLFKTTPFKEYKPFFNVFAINTVSKESGAIHYNSLSDCPTGANYVPTDTPNNLFGSAFDNGVHRCLYISNFFLLNNILINYFPMYDQIGVIVNTPYYGGCGGKVGVASTHYYSSEIIIHELGHSLGGLGDEYDYGNCNPGNGKNYTTETDTALIPWKAWIAPSVPIPTPGGKYCNTIGLYKGAYYCTDSVYRPKCDCKMRTLGKDFCEVCREHLIRVFHQYVNLIDETWPNKKKVKFCDSNGSVVFGAGIVHNALKSIKVTWLLDSSVIAKNIDSVIIFSSSLSIGPHELRLEVQDTTDWVRMVTLPPVVKTWTLTKKTSSKSNFSATACNSYIWEGKQYKSSGTYVKTISNKVGCDSVMTLNLTINKSTVSVMSDTACNSYNWRGKTYATSGTFKDTMLNVAGCDSIITLHLTVNKSSQSSITANSCDRFDWLGNTYTASGVYKDTFINMVGCDSIVALALTVNHSSDYNIKKSVCDSFKWKGKMFKTSGIYKDSLTTSTGCDSVIILNLNVKHSSSSVTAITACKDYSWQGKIYDASGTYNKIITNTAGCDSFMTLNLTINKVDTSVIAKGSVLTSNASNAKYQWIDCINSNSPIPGATQKTFIPSADGTYAVVVSSNNCTDTSSCYSIFTTSILRNTFGDSLNVFPNPTTGNLTVDLGKEYTHSEGQIVDISGKVISSFHYQSTQKFYIDIKGPKGTYFLKFKSGTGKSAIIKIVKE